MLRERKLMALLRRERRVKQLILIQRIHSKRIINPKKEDKGWTIMTRSTWPW
jgi:hypothetical protein